jgi:hypothetical protein
MTINGGLELRSDGVFLLEVGYHEPNYDFEN